MYSESSEIPNANAYLVSLGNVTGKLETRGDIYRQGFKDTEIYSINSGNSLLFHKETVFANILTK